MTPDQRLSLAIRNSGKYTVEQRRARIVAAYEDVTECNPIEPIAAAAVDVLEQAAQRREAREFAPHPDLDPELAALLNQHNADVDQRKANGEQRRGGWTYLDRLEATQENKR